MRQAVKYSEGYTVFELPVGARIPVGSETILLLSPTVVGIPKEMSYDAVVETVAGSSITGVPGDYFNFTETRDGAEYLVSFAANGCRSETLIAPAPVAATPKAVKPRTVSKSASDGKFVSKAKAKSSPKTTITQKV